MKVKFSKDFEGSVRKLSGKRLDSVRDTVAAVKKAQSLEDITNCKKLVDYDFIYRIRIGNYRAFLNFHVEIKDDVVCFLYLISRGQAYDKASRKNLRKDDI